MEGEEVCFFFVVFINLEKNKSFAYLPKSWDQNQVVHSQNRFVSWVDFKSL